jgi:hypothetical protein
MAQRLFLTAGIKAFCRTATASSGHNAAQMENLEEPVMHSEVPLNAPGRSGPR